MKFCTDREPNKPCLWTLNVSQTELGRGYRSRWFRYGALRSFQVRRILVVFVGRFGPPPSGLENENAGECNAAHEVTRCKFEGGRSQQVWERLSDGVVWQF